MYYSSTVVNSHTQAFFSSFVYGDEARTGTKEWEVGNSLSGISAKVLTKTIVCFFKMHQYGKELPEAHISPEINIDVFINFLVCDAQVTVVGKKVLT